MVVGCLEGECHYPTGNLRARKRVEQVQRLLETLGIGGGRLGMFNLSSSEAPVFVEVRQEMHGRVVPGPNPIQARRAARPRAGAPGAGSRPGKEDSMIIAEQKPIEEIIEQVRAVHQGARARLQRVRDGLQAGGQKEVGVLAAAWKLALRAGPPSKVAEMTVERQCDPEYLEAVRARDGHEAVLSMACGAGVQFTAERTTTPVLPGSTPSSSGSRRSAASTPSAARPAATACSPHGRHLPGCALRQAPS